MTTAETPLQEILNQKKRKLAEDMKVVKYEEQQKEIADLERQQRKQTLRCNMKLDETYDKWFDMNEAELREAVKESDKHTDTLKRICKQLHIWGRREFDCAHGDGVCCELCSADHY